MRRYGEIRKFRRPKIHGSHCGICHPSQKNRKSRAREEGKKQTKNADVA